MEKIMKVKELKKILERFDDDFDVKILCNNNEVDINCIVRKNVLSIGKIKEGIQIIVN